MIRIVYKSGRKLIKEEFKKSHLETVKTKNYWIDALIENEKELDGLLNSLGIKKSSLRDDNELRVYDDHAIFGFNCIMKDGKSDVMHFVFGSNYLITVHKNCSEISEKAFNQVSFSRFNAPFEIIYELLDEIMLVYGFYLEVIEDKINSAEESSIKRTGEREAAADIIRIRRKINNLSKILWREKELINLLKSMTYDFAKINEKEVLLFNDLHDTTIRLLSLINVHKDTLSDLITMRSNIIIRRLTSIMLILTVVSTVTVFPNTIATFFGIPRISDLAEESIIIIAIALSTIIPIYFLWKKGWFKT